MMQFDYWLLMENLAFYSGILVSLHICPSVLCTRLQLFRTCLDSLFFPFLVILMDLDNFVTRGHLWLLLSPFVFLFFMLSNIGSKEGPRYSLHFHVTLQTCR